MTGRDVIGLVRTAIISAVLFLSAAVVPVLGPTLALFAPTPILFYSVGLPAPLWRAAGAAILAAAIAAAVAGPWTALGFLITLGLAAVLMTYMLARRRPFEMIILVAAGVMVVVGTLAAFAWTGSPAALADSLRHDLIAAMARGEKFYKVVGVDVGLTADMQARVVDLTLRLSPALAAISAALTVLANLAVFWRITGRQQRVGYSLFGDLVRWSTPEWLIWAFLVSGFGLFIPMYQFATIALDCFICVAAVYFCQGLAIMAFYFRLLGMPPIARGLIYFVTIVQPVLAALVCGAGVFDLWIDFRRLKPPRQEAGTFGDFL